MGFWNRGMGVLVATGAVALWLAPAALAGEKVGVVTNVEGTATVARVALAHPQPLRFRDDVHLQDRITTGDRSLVRVLLGGKATVTARERSVVTITEVPGVATVELGEGRISVAVSKAMMKPGEVIQIRTPNAVSAIRGTVIVAEVFPGAVVSSTITVLRGLVDVTRLDAGHHVGRTVGVGALQSIQVTGANPLSPPRTISPAEAQRFTSEFRVIPTSAPSAATAPAVRHAVELAKQDAEAQSSPAGSAGAVSRTDRADKGVAVSKVEGTSDGIGDSDGSASRFASPSDAQAFVNLGVVSSGSGSSGSGSLVNVGSGVSGGASLLNVSVGGTSGRVSANSGPTGSSGKK